MPQRARRGLIAAALACGLAGAFTGVGTAPLAAAERAQLMQAFRWPAPAGSAGFGGFSGVEITADGLGMIAVSDAGTIWRLRIMRDSAGMIRAIRPAAPVHAVARARVDAEGLALGPDGRLHVSVEGPARLFSCRMTRAITCRRQPVPPAFAAMQRNSSLEALAVDDRGTLYTLPERSGAETRPFPVWRRRGGDWSQPFAIPRRGKWLPVGADFGPDGRFYLLERDFRGLAGFRTRVRVFDIAGDAILGEAVVLETRSGTHDNLEGLSVWRDGQGAIRLTMVADDNFSFLQRSEIVEYRLPPPAAPRKP